MLVLAGCFLFACEKKEKPAPAAPPATAPAPLDGKIRKSVGPSGGATNWMAQLTVEAQNRPKAALPAEDVYAAINAAGVKVEQPQQALGFPIGAKYCVKATAEGGTGVSVCEFTDEQAAAQGREVSLTKLAPAKNRLLILRKGTLITLTTTSEPPEADVEAKKIVIALEALK